MEAKRGIRGAVSNPRILFTLIGVCEGLLWWAVQPFGLESVGAADARIALLFFGSGSALVARFTWDGSSPHRWVVVALALGTIVGVVTMSVWNQLPDANVPYDGDNQRIAAWLLGAFAFLYITVPFAQIFQRSGQPRFPYPELFEHSWNNLFVGLVSTLFVSVFWAFLGVWSALFNVLGISLFADLFFSRPFEYLATATMFGYGLALGRANENVIRTLRRITLMIAHALLPFVALAALLFVLTLPFTGVDPLWETGSATPLVLALLGLFTLLLNGIFEDGKHQPPYPKLLLRGIKVAILTMPVFAAIALYGTGLRVEQYGLTPLRVYALLFTGVASLYALGYAIAALWPSSTWMGLIRPINVGTALVLAGLAIVVQLYPLDPLRLSAESQLTRIRDQKLPPPAFDFATLRFRLGHYGWDALRRLEEMDGHPNHEMIRAGIERVRAAESFWVAREPETTLVESIDFDTSPENLALPPGLLESFSRERSDLATGICDREKCLVLGVDLRGDGNREYCLLVGSGAWTSACYETRGHDFALIGRLEYRGPGLHLSLEALEDTLANEPIPTRAAPYKDIELENGVLELVRPTSWRAIGPPPN